MKKKSWQFYWIWKKKIVFKIFLVVDICLLQKSVEYRIENDTKIGGDYVVFKKYKSSMFTCVSFRVQSSPRKQEMFSHSCSDTRNIDIYPCEYVCLDLNTLYRLVIAFGTLRRILTLVLRIYVSLTKAQL